LNVVSAQILKPSFDIEHNFEIRFESELIVKFYFDMIRLVGLPGYNIDFMLDTLAAFDNLIGQSFIAPNFENFGHKRSKGKPEGPRSIIARRSE
jgi:hypothetical protein